MSKTSTMETLQITNFPEISSHVKRRFLVGVRPFRKGGIRLQKQQIAQKTIVHNYGHGGAGVSLAPATAQQAAILATQQCNKKQQICVLGCGIIGLMTALQCLQRGFKVKVLSERIPKQDDITGSKMTTSQVAPGYWLPYHYDFNDQKKHDFWSERSYIKYQEWINKSKSIRKIPVYQDMGIEQIEQKAPKSIFNTTKRINLKVGSKNFNLLHFQTIQINLQKFLQELLKLTKEKGMVFIQKSLNSKNDVLELPNKIIINCLGLGSKKIFGDENMYGVKGHLLQIRNTTQIKGIFGFRFKNEPVKLYCFDDKILIGLTKQNKQTNEFNWQIAKQLQQRAYQFYKSLELKNSFNSQIRPKL